VACNPRRKLFHAADSKKTIDRKEKNPALIFVGFAQQEKPKTKTR